MAYLKVFETESHGKYIYSIVNLYLIFIKLKAA